MLTGKVGGGMHAHLPIRQSTALAGLLVAASSLLVACGLSSTAGSQAGDEPNIPANGMPTEDPRQPTNTSSTDPTQTSAQGVVRLLLDKPAYRPGDKVVVSIENGLNTEIGVTDHHTDCGYTDLQYFAGGTWVPIGACKVMRPTRLVTLPAGSVTPQTIGIPSGASAVGTYRVALTYATGGGTSTAQLGPVYSPTFSVA